MLLIDVVLAASFAIGHSYRMTGFPPEASCFWRYPHFLTRHLECNIFTNNCGFGYMCSWHCHFAHPICVEGFWPERVNGGSQTITHSFKETYHVSNGCLSNKDCPKDQKCSIGSKACVKKDKPRTTTRRTTLPMVTTTPPTETTALPVIESNPHCPEDLPICRQKDVIYECESDDDCLYFETCCYSSCHKERICKNRVQPDVSAETEKCPPNNATNCTVDEIQNREVEYCWIHEDCSGGHICCQDGCSDSKICKKPEEMQENRCPKVTGKCTVPYSLRVAKKYECKKDEDCKLGELCCEDVCNDYFKVCKRVLNPKTFSAEDHLTAIFKKPVTDEGDGGN